MRAAALDYFDMADFVEHASYPDFDSWRRGESRRLCLLTTRGSVPHTAATFLPGDILMLGRESAGVPEAVAEGADLRLRIPMRSGTRSLNVAIAGSLVLGEALRQTGHFTTLT